MLVMALAAASPATAAPSKAKVEAEHARIVDYWTPSRMADANPRDFTKTKGGFRPAGKGSKRGKPPKNPTDPVPLSGGNDTVTGASWTSGGPAQGCWTAVGLVVHSGYATAGAFNSQAIRHDWAFAVVGNDSEGGWLDARVPGFPIAFDAHRVRAH